MNEPYLCSDLVAVAAGEKKAPPCDDTLGIRVTDIERGRAVAEWIPDTAFLNGHGVVMGGFISAAADVVAAYAMASCLADNFSFTSINLHTTFHRPVGPSPAEITATVDRLGNTMAYVCVEIQQDGRLAASTTSSVLIREAHHGK